MCDRNQITHEGDIPMEEKPESSFVKLEIAAGSDIDEVILAYRKKNELRELASIKPPVVAKVKKD